MTENYVNEATKLTLEILKDLNMEEKINLMIMIMVADNYVKYERKGISDKFINNFKGLILTVKNPIYKSKKSKN